MKVAYILPEGGSFIEAARAESQVLVQRHGIEVASHRMPENKRTDVPPGNWKIKGLTGFSALPDKLKAYPKALKWKARRNLRLAGGFSDAMLVEKAEVIHLHYGGNAILTAFFCKRLTGLPITVTAHTSEVTEGPEREAFEAADKVFVHSQFTAQRLRSQRIKCEVMKPPLDLRWFVGKERLDRKDKDVMVLMTHIPDDYRYIVDAIHRIGPGYHIWITGTAPKGFKDAIQKLRLTRRVTFFDILLPFERPYLERSCDIFCLPSMPSGTDMPIELVEAMACARPCIAPGERAIPEFLDGVLLKGKSSEELAKAISSFGNDPDLRARAGARNINFAKEHFVPGNVDKLQRAFMRLSGGMGRE